MDNNYNKSERREIGNEEYNSLEVIEAGHHRSLKGFWRWITILLSLTFIYYAVDLVFDFRLFMNIIPFEGIIYYFFVSVTLPLVYLFYPINKDLENKTFLIDVLISILLFVTLIYFTINGYKIIATGWGAVAPIHAAILAAILWFFIVEGIRRVAGMPLTIVVFVVSLFPLFANSLPGFFRGNSLTLPLLTRYHFFTFDSAFGMLLVVYINIIISFICFSTVGVKVGAGKFVLDLALSIFGSLRGGTAKVAILASALFGSINGQPVLNVITTGSVTIPVMKETGFPPYYAGAVEACASTGGTFTPPVMGATAFVMASYLGVAYSDIAIAAALPAILYYAPIFLQVDAYAARTGIKGLSKDKVPSFYKTLKNGWGFIISTLLLIYFLFFLRRIAEGAFISTACLLLFSQVQKRKAMVLEDYFQIIEEIGRSCAMLLILILGVGLLIGSFSVTGIAFSFARETLAAAKGNLALILIACAASSYILGMGMSALACYIFLAIIMAPALVNAGINPMAAHLFIYYCGMLSYITLPVALAVYPAAVLAKSSISKVGKQSMKLGVALLFLPFIFVLDPNLLLQGGVWAGLFSFARTFLAIFIFCSVLEKYMFGVGFFTFNGLIGKLTSIVLIFSAMLIGIPEKTTVLGIAIAMITLFFMFYTKKIQREAIQIK